MTSATFMAINLDETWAGRFPAVVNQIKGYCFMGMNLGGMIYLQKLGLLTRDKNVFMDIGPQTVYFTTDPQIREFVANQGQAVSDEVLESEIKRLVYFSTPRPEERTTFFSEISDLTNIDYHSFDVCPGLKTDLLDLNFDRLPPEHANRYDVLINFGTTEHIFNQWNSFEVMHDATKVGGVMYHQLPMSAYLDHGYYCYTPLFFKELAEANGYEIVDQFICIAGQNNVRDLGLDVRGIEQKLCVPQSGKITKTDERIPCFNIHVVLKKTKDAPFRVSLEIATAHSQTTDLIMSRYTGTASSSMEKVVEFASDHSDIENRIAALVADREKRISKIVADRERRVSELVSERNSVGKNYELRISELVAEREAILSERRTSGARYEATISELVAEREAMLSERRASGARYEATISELVAERNSLEKKYETQVSGLVTEREALLVERQTSSARYEVTINELVAARDSALSRVEAMHKSMSWKITSPIRAILGGNARK